MSESCYIESRPVSVNAQRLDLLIPVLGLEFTSNECRPREVMAIVNETNTFASKDYAQLWVVSVVTIPYRHSLVANTLLSGE